MATITGSHRSLVDGALSWLRPAARGFHLAYNGAAPTIDELIAEGTIVVAQLAPRFDATRGAAFSTFCHRHVITRWQRLREREQRERPVGGLDEILRLLRVEGKLMVDDDADHQRRADELADTFIAGSELEDAVDLKRIFEFIERLPEPQPTLLVGIFREGKNIAQLMHELGLNRGQARWKLKAAMTSVTHHFTDKPS